MNGTRPSGTAEEWDRLSDELTRENTELRETVQRMYDHYIQWCRATDQSREVWAGGSVLLNAALPLQLRRVVP